MQNTYKYFFALSISVVVLMFLFYAVLTSPKVDPFSDIDGFVGCYGPIGGSLIELSSDSRVHSTSGVSGTYLIREPVGGKHGYLLVLRDVEVRRSDEGATLVRSRVGQMLAIDQSGLISIFFEDGRLVLHKGPCNNFAIPRTQQNPATTIPGTLT